MSKGATANLFLWIPDISERVYINSAAGLPVRSYALVGETTTDTFTNKVIIDPSNDVAANRLRNGTNIATLGAVAPLAGQVLTATSGTVLQWATPAIVGGTFIDANTHIASIADSGIRLNFLVGGTLGTAVTMGTAQTVNRNFILPDISGTALVSETGTVMVYIGATTTLHGSSSGVQMNSTVANRAQYRGNQYGNATGIPGFSAFKSRSAVIGGLAPVQPGDVVFRVTASGVTDNLSIPLCGMISINVVSVPAGQGYIGTEFELQLVSNTSSLPNGRHVVFKIDNRGHPMLLEPTSAHPDTFPASVPSGLVALNGATGTIVVPNAFIQANSRVLLTIQPGPAPLGTIWVSNITAGVSFTIASTNAIDACNVYYQIWNPLP